MTPLKMLLLVTLLLGSCLQDSHAGESRGQEGWGPRDHSSNTHMSVCFLHHIYSYQDVGGWWQEAFKGGIQRKIITTLMMRVRGAVGRHPCAWGQPGEGRSACAPHAAVVLRR